MLGLAAAVLAREDVVLAMQVLGSGQHSLDRAVELAAVVLRGAEDESGAKCSG